MYNNDDAEKCIIGVMLASNGDKRITAYCMTLSEKDFDDPYTRKIFQGCKEIYGDGQPVDIITLGNHLSQIGVSVAPKDLLQYAALTPATANYRSYVRAVKECSERRRIRDIAYRLIEKSSEGNLVEACDKAIRELSGNAADDDNSWKDMTSLVCMAFDRISSVSEGKITPIRTGIESIDKIFGGFDKGELTILAARPSVGKSAFGIHIALEAAKCGKTVAIVSREMSPESIGTRMLSTRNNLLRIEKLRDAKLSGDEWVILGDAVNELAGYSIYSIYNCRTVEDLNHKMRVLESSVGKPDLLIVDYAQLMHTTGKQENRVAELEYVSGSVKSIAMDMQIPVLLLAQVKRSGMRQAVMPTMDELKGSGSFEQDADNILLLHRPESEDDEIIKLMGDARIYQSYKSMGLQYIALRIAKQRQGQVGGVTLCYDPAHNRYTGIRR